MRVYNSALTTASPAPLTGLAGSDSSMERDALVPDTIVITCSSKPRPGPVDVTFTVKGTRICQVQ